MHAVLLQLEPLGVRCNSLTHTRFRPRIRCALPQSSVAIGHIGERARERESFIQQQQQPVLFLQYF